MMYLILLIPSNAYILIGLRAGKPSATLEDLTGQVDDRAERNSKPH